MNGNIEGFDVPLHRALTEPILLAGAPRSIAIVNGTIAAALGLGLQMWLAGILLWVIGHSLAVFAARRDPDFAQVIAPPSSAEGVALMLNLAEYRTRPDRLADHLPWALLVASGIVLNKDGSFQKSFRFRGPDLESATQAELVSACARLNNVLRRFGSGWALFFEAERFEAPDYPHSEFPEAASWLVDEERRAGVSG